MTQLFNGWRRTAEIYTVSQKTCHFVSFFHDVCTNGNRKLWRRTELFLQRSENHPDSYDALNISALFVLLKYIVSHKKTSHLFVDVITAFHDCNNVQDDCRWPLPAVIDQSGCSQLPQKVVQCSTFPILTGKFVFISLWAENLLHSQRFQT